MLNGSFKFECRLEPDFHNTVMIGGNFSIDDGPDHTRRISHSDGDRQWFADVPEAEFTIDALLELIRVRLGLEPRINGGFLPRTQ
jgi:hypothetical protein